MRAAADFWLVRPLQPQQVRPSEITDGFSKPPFMSRCLLPWSRCLALSLALSHPSCSDELCCFSSVGSMHSAQPFLPRRRRLELRARQVSGGGCRLVLAVAAATDHHAFHGGALAGVHGWAPRATAVGWHHRGRCMQWIYGWEGDGTVKAGCRLTAAAVCRHGFPPSLNCTTESYIPLHR